MKRSFLAFQSKNSSFIRALSVISAGTLLFSLSSCSFVTRAPSDSSSSSPVSPPPVEATLKIISGADLQYTSENCELVQYPESAVHEGNLILVNNSIPFVFPEDQQDSLQTVLEEKGSGYKVKDNTVQVDGRIMDSLNNMLADFNQATGYGDVTVVSGFRTEEYQQMLLDREIQQSGEETARKWVAKPGGSEHHTGLAIDFSIYHDNGLSSEYDGTGEPAWINQNSWKYGFILRYPDDKRDITGIYYEPWHFRWVGLPHAAAVTKEGICLEEYIDYLRQFTFDGSHYQIQCGEKTYEVWFEYGTQVHVPKEGSYTVSGNNVDGFIVTAEQNTAE